MTATELRDYLAELKAAGVAKAHLSWGFGPTTVVVSVTFAESVKGEQVAPFVDSNGKSIDLDEGAPPLARENAMDELWAKNFPASK